MSEDTQHETPEVPAPEPSIVSRAEEFLKRVEMEGIQDYQAAVQHLKDFVNHFRGPGSEKAEATPVEAPSETAPAEQAVS